MNYGKKIKEPSWAELLKGEVVWMWHRVQRQSDVFVVGAVAGVVLVLVVIGIARFA